MCNLNFIQLLSRKCKNGTRVCFPQPVCQSLLPPWPAMPNLRITTCSQKRATYPVRPCALISRITSSLQQGVNDVLAIHSVTAAANILPTRTVASNVNLYLRNLFCSGKRGGYGRGVTIGKRRHYRLGKGGRFKRQS